MPTSHEQITAALDLLTHGLYPFVERALKEVYHDNWIEAARRSYRETGNQALPAGSVIRWDAHSLLTAMWDHWNGVFRTRLGHFERSLISELREFRNRWAHQATFNFDDTYRFLDSTERLLTAVGAAEARDAARAKREVLKDEFGEEVNAANRQMQSRKDKRVAITVYVTCCVAIVMQLFNSLGTDQAYGLAIVTVAFFAFMIRKRLVALPPIFGPHECSRCGKIIYSNACPYCAALPGEYDAMSAVPAVNGTEAATSE